LPSISLPFLEAMENSQAKAALLALALLLLAFELSLGYSENIFPQLLF